MTQDFISVQDRIIAAAIDIISESGLAAVTQRNISLKMNLREDYLYRYYGDVNDILFDVVDYYFKFDKSLQKTILAKKSSYVDKISQYIDAYATYYDNYYAISTIMLHYEEFLHNSKTQEIISTSLLKRHEFLVQLFQGAIDEGEIKDSMTAEQYAHTIRGILMLLTFNKRIEYKNETFKQQFKEYTKNFYETVRKQ